MKTVSTNVAIFGSGLAGMCAALTLVENGIKDVTVFEKRPFQGGALSNTPMCVLVTRNDQAYQDRAFKVHCEYTNYAGNLAASRAWLNNSWRIVPFIEHLGLNFIGKLETPIEDLGRVNAYGGGFPKGMNVGDTYFLPSRGKGHGAALIILRSVQRFKKLGGKMVFNTALQELIREENGRCTGAIVKEKNGKTYQVNANAIVVATGGVSDDRELVKEMTGLTYTDRECSAGGNIYFNHFKNGQMTGDGQKAIWKIGGARTCGAGFGTLVPYPGVVDYVPWIARNQIHTIAEQPYLAVNINGKRFVDESCRQASVCFSTAMQNQPGKRAFLIFDDATMDHLEQEGTEYAYMIFPADKITDGRGQFRDMIENQHNESFFICNSIEELADKTGIDKEQLIKTVKRYNDLCDKGHDDDFAKDPKYMRPVRTGKIYCIHVTNTSYVVDGGIRIDENCNVVDEMRRPIPGLFAGGDMTLVDIFGEPGHNVCSISNIAYTQGFICADSITRELKGGK